MLRRIFGLGCGSCGYLMRTLADVRAERDRLKVRVAELERRLEPAPERQDDDADFVPMYLPDVLM